MKLKCFQMSSPGAVRDRNEDFCVFWEPEDFQRQQQLGSLAIVADGVGGEGHGDIASKMAAETALEVFKEGKPETSTTEIVRGMFENASNKVFQASQNNGRMATTL